MAHLLFDYFLHFHRFLLICKLKENLVRGDCVRIEVGDHESKLKKIYSLPLLLYYLFEIDKTAKGFVEWVEGM